MRRAQHKADVNGTLPSDSSKKGDPSENPITRRPGPGRGRPKKQATEPDAPTGQEDVPVTPTQGQVQQPPQSPLPPPAPLIDGHLSGVLPISNTLPTQDPDSLDLVDDDDDGGDDDDEFEEQRAKRQRLDDSTDHLDDSAGLAMDDGNVDSMVNHDMPE